MAETVVEDAEREAGKNVGFCRLAGFIFVGNKAKESIAMIAPVTTACSEKIAMRLHLLRLNEAVKA